MALMSCAQSQQYHYPRPNTPFQVTPQRPSAKYIVQTLGPHGRTYELQAHLSPAVYVSHESHLVPGIQQQQQQQYHHQIPHQVQQPQQQQYLPPSSLHQNPLLINTNSYPQMSAGLAAPPAPNSYYSQPQLQAHAPAPNQLQQSADSYYSQPQALTVAQPASNYGPPQQQQQQQHQQLQQHQRQPHNSNPQPYAIVTLPHGQRVQDGGHGSGPPPPEVNGYPAAPPRIGDYNAQSPSSALDTYDYKQSIPGDTRNYQRHVTNCMPNGQCQQLNLNPGQIDIDHHKVLHAARAQTQPAKVGCQPDNFVPPGAQPNAQGQLRPKDRRLHAHVQEQVARYPYN
ncbi:neurogenic protein mastermind [Drosophila grimshawi]|nr:neurogenic protein mastermind [Drosophila grimshawi]